LRRFELWREHPVVERGYRAGILALDRREDLRQVLVRAHSDAADALIRVHDDKWHLGDTRWDVPVDVAHRTTPVMDRLQRAIACDLHRHPCSFVRRSRSRSHEPLGQPGPFAIRLILNWRSIDTTSYK